MNFADRVKETTTSTSAAVIALGGAAATFRSFASSLAVGDTKIPVSMDDGKGNWENGEYTLTDATTLTRTAIYASSNGGAPTVFPAGVKDVFCTLSSEALAVFLSSDDGLTIEQLPTASTIADADYLTLTKPGNGDFKITVAALKAAFGGTPQPGDTTAPTVSSAQVANAAPNVIAITFNEALAGSTPSVSAFTVSGGKTVSSVSISGAVATLTVNSAYAAGDTITVGYTQPVANPRLQDAVGNAVATFSGRAVTNNIVPAGSTVTGVTVSPSTASVAGGGTQQFTASVAGTGSPSQGVTWSASAGSITSGGLFTAPAATSSDQSVTITATSAQDATKSGTAAVTVPATAAATPYTITGFGGNAVRSTIDASAAMVYGSIKQIGPGSTVQTTTNQYWNVKQTTGGADAASVVSGWGESASTPPATITQAQNTNGSNSINGMTPMGKASAFGNNANLWVPVGTDPTKKWYFWIKPVDGAAQCMNPSGTTVTGA